MVVTLLHYFSHCLPFFAFYICTTVSLLRRWCSFLLARKITQLPFFTMEEKTITFNDIPEAMNYLITKMNDLEEMIRTSAVKQPDRNDWFNLEELCDYLPDRPAKQTVYSWVNQKKIPYHKKGKKLQFLKCEIDEWLHTDELQQEIIANPVLQTNKKRRRS